MLPSYRAAARRHHRRRGASDTFTRPDNATSLGLAESGQSWQADAGTWGVTGGKAYNPSGTSGDVATLDAGIGDGTYAVDMTAADWVATGGALLFRRQSATTGLEINLNAGTPILYKRVGGVATQLASGSSPTVNGSTYRVAAAALGARVDVSINGTLIFSHTLSSADQALFLAGGFTRAGLMRGGSGTAFTFDNFSAQRP